LPVREFDFSYTDNTKVKISATDKVGKEILVYNGKNMKSELYINKAFMQLKKGDIDGAVCSMKKVIETNDDIVSLVQAHCLLAEYYFIRQNYACSKEHIDWIMERQGELENEYDDLLNDEIINTNVLGELIDKYLLA
jgi:hypothetical protein